jgi:hypothetical protein
MFEDGRRDSFLNVVSFFAFVCGILWGRVWEMYHHRIHKYKFISLVAYVFFRSDLNTASSSDWCRARNHFLANAPWIRVTEMLDLG